MPDPLQALLSAGALPTTSFPTTSRYAEVGVEAWDPGDARPPIPYLARRFCPLPSSAQVLFVVRVREGDRRDLLASEHLGDPELWWQLADGNGVVDPRNLTDVPGTSIAIAVPERPAGGGNA